MSLHHILTCVVHVVISVIHTSSLSPEAIQLKQVLQQELHRYAARLDNSAMQMHENYHRSRRIPNLHRTRRSTDTDDYRHAFVAGTGVGNREEFGKPFHFTLDKPAVSPNSSSFVVLDDVIAIAGTSLDVKVSAWEYYILSEQEYLATIQPEEEKVEVFKIDLTSETPLTSIFNYSVNASCIEVSHLTRAMRAGSSETQGSFLAIGSDERAIILSAGGTFEVNQTMHIEAVTDIETFEINSITYLAITRANQSSAATKSLLYKWSSTYTKFLLSQEIATYNAVKVTSFSIGDSMYLAFAEKTNQSLAYRYDQKLSVFKMYQRLLPNGASHVLYFTSAYTHFLAFVTTTTRLTVIYEWTVRTFEKFQELDTPSANMWTALSLPNCQDGTILLLSSDLPSPNTLQMYQYSFTELLFVKVNVSNFLNFDDTILGAKGAEMITQIGGPLYIAISFNKNSTAASSQVDILEVKTSSQPRRDPFQEEMESLEQDVVHITKLLDEYEEMANTTKIRIEDAVTIDGSQEITGLKRYIGSVRINGTITVAEIEIDGDVVIPTPEGGDPKLNEVEEILANHSKYLADLPNAFNNTVTLDTNQTVTGFKQFTNVIIENTLVTGNLTADTINGFDMHQLDMEAIRLNRPSQVVDGPITFTQGVNMTSGLNITGEINGMDLETDAVLTDKIQTITGSKLIDNSIRVTGNADVANYSYINGLDISEELVTIEGNYTLAGEIVFQDVLNISGDIITTGPIDGVNLTELVADVMTTTGNQTILGNVTMLSVARFYTDVEVTGFVNGLDLSDIDERAVKINEDRQITGKKILRGPIVVEGDIQVNGTVDGLEWPEDVLTISGNHTIFGEKTFVGYVNITSPINVTGTVDGLDLSEEVVTLTGNHTVNGRKSFSSGIGVAGDVHVDGTVDGVDLSELELVILTLSTYQIISDDVVFVDPVKFLGNLSVDGLVNDIDLMLLYQDAVFRDGDEVQVITGNKTFANIVNVTTGLLEIFGLVNGYDMTEDFMDKISDQNVTGEKTFVDGFTVQSNITVDGLIHGVNLTRLYEEAVLTWRDASISGHKTFLSNVDIDGSLVMTDSATVAGLDVSEDFMMTNREQTVTGDKYFDQIEVHQDLLASNLTVWETLNGRNWTEFIINRITLTTDQVIDGHHILANSSHIFGNVTVNGTVNGVNLTWLADNIMSKSKEQTITGNITFEALVSVIGDVTCSGLIDGVNISDLKDRAMFVDENHNITGLKTFMNDVDVGGDLHLEGLLNGVNITWLIEDAVYKNRGPQNVSAEKTFLDGFTVNQNVNVSGRVNGIDLSEEILTASTDQQVSGFYTFLENVTVTGNFDVLGEINGIDLREFNATVMKTDIPQVVTATLIFVQDVFIDADDVPVLGFVDGVNLTALRLNAVMLDELFVLNGDLSFTTPVVFLDDINATGLIHGLDFAEWAAEVVTIDTEQTIPNLRIFTDDIRMTGGINVTANISATTIFGRDFDKFIDDAVLLQGNQIITGQKVIKGDLIVQGNINVTGTVDGIKVATDVVTLDGNQTVSGNKTFSQRMTVNGDIVISGLVNGVDVNASEADSFKINDPTDILARKIFEQTLIVHGDMSVGGLVDGIDLDQEAVTLHTDQVVDGKKTFLDGMNIIGHAHVTTGYVCNTSLTDLGIDRVSLSGDEVINGTLTFTGHVTFEDDVFINMLLNGVDLQELQALQDEITAFVEEATREIGWIIDMQCKEIDQLQAKYLSVFSDLIHLSEVQTIPVHAQSFEHFTIEGVPHLAMARVADDHGAMCIDSIIYQWNQNETQFEEKERLATRGAKSWHAFWIDSVLYLAVANSNTLPCEGETEVANTIFNYNGSHFEYFQDLVGGGTIEIKSIAIGGRTYLAVANSNNSVTNGESYIYIYDQRTQQFRHYQNISAGDACAVEFCQVNDGVFLVYADSQTDFTPVYIYDTESRQFVLNHTLDSSMATDVTCFEFEGRAGLMIANHGRRMMDGSVDFAVEIIVYYWSETTGTFEFSAFIPEEKAVSVKPFLVADYLYVAVVSQYNKFELFKYQGTVDFVSVLSQEWNGIVSVEVFNMAYNNHIHFAVGIDPLDSNEMVNPMILDGNVIGELFDPVDGLCDDKFARSVFHDPET